MRLQVIISALRVQQQITETEQYAVVNVLISSIYDLFIIF